MKYGTKKFDIRAGSLSIAKANRTKVNEYPGTDLADYFDLGKSPTKIAMDIIAGSESEKILLESLLHTPNKRNLELTPVGEYYKDVVSGDYQANPYIDIYTGDWIIPVQFIALDPVPYDVDTDEVMY